MIVLEQAALAPTAFCFRDVLCYEEFDVLEALRTVAVVLSDFHPSFSITALIT